MRTLLLLLLAFAAPAFASQTVWKWVDDKGVTHYSDRPVPGATRMEIRVGNTSDSASQPASPPSTSSSAPAAPTGPVYRNFEIWQPAAEEALINTGGQVTVNVRVDPALQTGHELHLYLDGRLVEGFAPNTASYELENVPRGRHSVVAVINDNRGTRVQETASVTFNVRQESIAQPPVGPALRPPPKPRPSS